ncbi:DUF7671 family protein [Leuconostoc mesenteroides]|uniref:DUF7671 family protein n=1 Tax=Leuconostoc mesenteroides TaxID=1245 RepID=UPI00038A7BCB|nr:hypothetical protein [Leuconostoc mesenteroides]EQC83853.1 hypothetical protein LMT8_02135 [Leuconostoc mesenteroides subsp. cremoris TIFN8]KDA51314.1 hypothetical protein L963_1872 [Leuconostoc mesenteroides subsp. cremoris T26]MDG9750376.1 hypothetical protein [Leuconostoc mesenteroides]ORI38181.1 hypothetical protein BMR90_04470 [Leuconostoc mesenteroides subsp. cremoris]ORI38775.1 hypothetical protein BMR89_04230 [Leuconostoc mesenteroides subsp. cremoris]
MSKDKYETHLFTGIVVEQDLSGNYVPKDGATLHRWRTGKHTKGKYKHTGQVFLTENNQSVAVLSQEKLGLEFLVLESISIPKVLGPF